ncbi:ribonuclease P protein subunit p20 [Sylvia borin]
MAAFSTGTAPAAGGGASPAPNQRPPCGARAYWLRRRWRRLKGPQPFVNGERKRRRRGTREVRTAGGRISEGGPGGFGGGQRMSSGRPAAPSPPPAPLPGAAPSSRRRRRGPAPGPPSGPAAAAAAAPGSNDVFVTSRSDFRAQLRRCQRLLAPGGAPGTGTGELRLHGLGLAVPRTINLALQLQAGAGGALRLHASTSSVPLRAHRDPRDHRDGDGDDGDTPRHNSAIHIRLCREAPCA